MKILALETAADPGSVALWCDGTVTARTGPLDTLPFYQACRARLSDKGLLGVNLLGRDKTFPASVERLRQAFDQRVAVFPSCDSGNTIAFATAPVSVRM